MRPTRLIGLDLATKTGWGVWDNGAIECGSFTLPKGEPGERFYAFRQWLYALCVNRRIECAAIEQPLQSDIVFQETKKTVYGYEKFKSKATNMQTLLLAYGLRAEALSVFASLNIPSYEANQASWRSKFIGTSRAPDTVPAGDRSKWFKKQARKACEDKNIEAPNDDAAEGVGVVEWLSGELGIAVNRDSNLLL